MHTDEKMPAGDGNPTAGHTDAAIVPPTAAPVLMMTGKGFATLQTAFALRGHTLHRHGGAEGAAGLYAVRWGLVRDLATAEDARRFLAQTGGSL
jgi:hypothetical protein